MTTTLRRARPLLSTYQELSAYVNDHEGVVTVSARRLRDIHGAQRLGSEIRADISIKLRRLGLGHLPVEIPDDHRQFVRVYAVGSPVGDLITAAHEVGSKNDRALREAVNSPLLLKRMRELLLDGK